jgi:hypothetical protein
LISIGNVRTVVAHVAPAIAIGVLLLGVCRRGAVVLRGAPAIAIGVVDRVDRARVTNIPQAVPIEVLLERIRRGWTVVKVAGDCRIPRTSPPITVGIDTRIADVACPIPIDITLVGIGHVVAIVLIGAPAIVVGVVVRIERAEIASVAQAIAIRILLEWVRDGGTVVQRAGGRWIPQVPAAIAVEVRTRIADIADAVQIGIGLVGIWYRRTVVERASVRRLIRITQAVAVDVRAVIAGVGCSIPIGVGLGRVEAIGAVVTDVPHAVRIGVGLIRIVGTGTAIRGTGVGREPRIPETISVAIRAAVNPIREAIVIGVRNEKIRQHRESAVESDGQIRELIAIEISHDQRGRIAPEPHAEGGRERAVAAPKPDGNIMEGLARVDEVLEAV